MLKSSRTINGKDDCIEYINCKDILCDIALYMIKTR